MVRWLEVLGFEQVISDSDGLYARERLASETGFDLVITDRNMPLMDGLQLALEIKTKPTLAHIKVFMISGMQKTGPENPPGVHEYFTKPADLDLLHMKIDEHFP